VEFSISDCRPDPPAGGYGIDPAPASPAQIVDLIEIRKSQIANRNSQIEIRKSFRFYDLKKPALRTEPVFLHAWIAL